MRYNQFNTIINKITELKFRISETKVEIRGLEERDKRCYEKVMQEAKNEIDYASSWRIKFVNIAVGVLSALAVGIGVALTVIYPMFAFLTIPFSMCSTLAIDLTAYHLYKKDKKRAKVLEEQIKNKTYCQSKELYYKKIELQHLEDDLNVLVQKAKEFNSKFAENEKNENIKINALENKAEREFNN